jgi:amidase
MKFSEYAAHDGLGLAELVRGGQVTPRELLDTALAAVEEVNPRINAVINVLRSQAEKEATGPLPEGPFRGVPFLVKDLVLGYAGVPTAMGSRLFAGFVAPGDSELMARYRRAGLVTIGKTNTPELGVSFSTEPVAFGPTKNPWDLTRIAGGSSGGSAAAVAARIVPLAHANDGGGSIRVPASCCGLFGLKPTRGRTPIGPSLAEGWNGLGIEHAVSRSVRDSAALLDATAGGDVGAPYAAAPPERPYLEETRRAPGRLRIAFSDRTFNGVKASGAARESLKKTVKLCEELGHELVEATPSYSPDELRAAFGGIVAANLAFLIHVVGPMFGMAPSPDNIEASNWALAERGRRLSASDLLGFQAMMNTISRQVGGFFTQFDVLLTPTLPGPLLPLGELDMSSAATAELFLEKCTEVSPYTPVFNLTGNPAMSVPLHHDPDGLPRGMHFVGRHGDEATLFRLAGQLEQAAPWDARRPPVCAG